MVKFRGYVEDDPILVAMGKIHDMINSCAGEIKGKSWNEEVRYRLIRIIESYRDSIVNYLKIAPGLGSSAESLGAKIQLMEKKLRKEPFRDDGFKSGKDFLRKLRSTLVVDLEAMLKGLEKKPRHDEYEAGLTEIKRAG